MIGTMTAKKRNGHDPGTQAIVEVLERIEQRLGNMEAEARATNERLERVEQEVRGVREEFHAFRQETREDLAAVCADVSGVRAELSSLRAETRVDNAIYHEEMRSRVRKLEEAITLN